AEDGIRDFHVTGVQTCALPISSPSRKQKNIRIRIRSILTKPMRILRAVAAPKSASQRLAESALPSMNSRKSKLARAGMPAIQSRSEERRVGKECRARWSAKQ